MHERKTSIHTFSYINIVNAKPRRRRATSCFFLIFSFLVGLLLISGSILLSFKFLGPVKMSDIANSLKKMLLKYNNSPVSIDPAWKELDEVEQDKDNQNNLNQYKFGIESSEKSIQTVYKSIFAIYQRYEMNHDPWMSYLMMIWNIKEDGWNLLKYKFAIKILQGRVFNTSPTFTMIFGGSSVSAGHDHHFDQSFPMVIEKELSPILSSFGIRLLLRNVAQSKVSCRVMNYCISSMAMNDIQGKVDFIAWENSFGCPRDPDVYEFAARLASWNKAIVYYSASGGQSFSHCMPSKDEIPWITDQWQPDMSGFSSFVVNQAKVESYKRKMFNFSVEYDSTEKFTKALAGRYEGVGAHGFSMWAKRSKACESEDTQPRNKSSLNKKSSFKTSNDCEASSKFKKMCHDMGGPHWVVQEGNARGSSKGDNAWHPPLGMHILRAELLVYNYAYIFLDSLFMIESDRQGQYSYQEMIAKYELALEKQQKPVPAQPLHCKPWECGRQSPRCLTDFSPTFTNFSSKAATTASDVSISSRVVKLGVGWGRVFLPGVKDAEEFKYLDTKHYYLSQGPNKVLSIRLPEVIEGRIKIYCVLLDKFRLPEFDLYIDPFFYPSSSSTNQTVFPPYKPSDREVILLSTNYSVSEDALVAWDVPKGHGHVLSIKTARYIPGSHRVGVSHIVVF